MSKADQYHGITMCEYGNRYRTSHSLVFSRAPVIFLTLRDVVAQGGALECESGHNPKRYIGME